ncbi:MAG TPA: hypothetical protein VFA16_17545 [Mycobacterium sp.]|nr:hypothetical protein [Mycobacterium sp.]
MRGKRPKVMIMEYAADRSSEASGGCLAVETPTAAGTFAIAQTPERGTPAEPPERLTPEEPPERLSPAETPERLTPPEPPERLTPPDKP